MRGRLLTLRGWISLAAFAMVAAALILVSLHIHRAQKQTATTPKAIPSPLGEMLHELAHCRDRGPAAQYDRACIAAWEENRRHFFDERRAP